MTKYETLLCEADKLNLIIKEKDLLSSDGRIKGDRIAIRKDLTETEKNCTMAEELGHYHLTVGNIIDQTNSNNRKQERIARYWAYSKLITFDALIDAFNDGCRNLYEFAEHIGVTEQFLVDAMEQFKLKYGHYKKVGDFIFIFYPHYDIIKKL